VNWRRAAAGVLLAAACCAARLAGAMPVLELSDATVLVNHASAQEVVRTALPYHWDRAHRGEAGTAEIHLEFPGSGFESQPHGMYIPRLGSRAEVWLNGTLLAELGNVGETNTSDFQKSPQYIPVPPGMLQARNVLMFRLSADIGRRAGLSTVWIGPADDVYPLYRAAFQRHVFTSLVIVVFGLLVAGFALVLWLIQTDIAPDGRVARDNLYLAAAAAELFWAIRVGDVAIQHPPLPWPAWGIVATAAFAGWICCVCLFCHRVAGWHLRPGHRWFRLGLTMLFLSSIAASWLALAKGEPALLTGWLGVANLFAVCYALIYFISAWRNPQPFQRLVATAGVINVAMGVRDWVTIRISGNYADSTWIRFSSVLFGLALAYIVLSRFRDARAQARDLMANLQLRVREREAELAGSYQELERLAREQERARERSSVLRDLHDGVGAHISSAIRQLKSGGADDAVLLQTLTDSLDHLKLTVDSLNTPPGDVGALLASMRYRLEPRFARSAMRLEWHVSELGPIARLDASAMRHLQFLLYEALSNVLQHSETQALRIEATQQGDSTVVRIVDDGRGFDVHGPGGKGLVSMRERANALDAMLRLDSRPGCTVVEATIPHPMKR
jgi:signal transduction histidine kinase